MQPKSSLFSTIREPLKRWLRLLVFAVVAIIGLVRVGISFIVLQTPNIYIKDLMQEYTLIRAARAGIYPYAPLPELVEQFVGKVPVQVLPHPTPHPPPVIIFFYPLGLIPYELAAHIWLWLEIGSVLLIAILLVQWTTGKLTRYAVFVTTMGLLSWNAVAYELLVGQITLVILLLLIGAWLLLRHEKPIGGGILLGIALALKLFAWPLVLFLVIKRAWKAMLAAIGIFALANAAAAGLVGFDVLWDYYRSIGPSIPAYYQSFGFNFSLTTLGWRLFDGTGSQTFLAFAAPPLFKSPLLAQGVSFFAPAILVGCGLIMALRHKNFDAGYGLFAIIAVLISPVTWVYYFIPILIPLAVTLRALAQQQFPRRLSFLFFGLVGLLGIFSEALLDRIIYAFSSSTVNGEALVPFWVGMLSYTPVVVLIALVGVMLAVTADE